MAIQIPQGGPFGGFPGNVTRPGARGPIDNWRRSRGGAISTLEQLTQALGGNRFVSIASFSKPFAYTGTASSIILPQLYMEPWARFFWCFIYFSSTEAYGEDFAGTPRAPRLEASLENETLALTTATYTAEGTSEDTIEDAAELVIPPTPNLGADAGVKNDFKLNVIGVDPTAGAGGAGGTIHSITIVTERRISI